MPRTGPEKTPEGKGVAEEKKRRRRSSFPTMSGRGRGSVDSLAVARRIRKKKEIEGRSADQIEKKPQKKKKKMKIAEAPQQQM